MSSRHLPVRLNVKVFAEWPDELPTSELIPIFHRWIQEANESESSAGPLFIDVADYSHVPEGPGVILVGHEAQIALDQAQARPGLLYSQRVQSESSGSDDVALRAVLRAALEVCSRLEGEERLEGVRFDGSEIELRINDRLTDGQEARAALRTSAEALAAELYDGSVTIDDDPSDVRHPATVRLSAKDAPGPRKLASRLSSTAPN